MPIFQDDPDAIAKLEAKLAGLEKEKAYWKGLKPERRTFGNAETDNMRRSFMLPLTNQNIRSVKQKIEMIKARQDRGATLERKTTFVGGKKRFYYEEKPLTDVDGDPKTFAKNGYSGIVGKKTLFVVGEGNKKEFVSRKSVNVFDVNQMFSNKPSKSVVSMTKNLEKKKTKDFDFMGGF